MFITNQRIVHLAYRIFRLVILGLLLTGSFVLWTWNRDNDPRFYHFLNSRPGKIIGSVIGWTEKASPTDKAEADMTLVERGYKRSLELVMQRRQPEHVIHLNDGTQMEGRIVGETPAGIRFQPLYGEMKMAEQILSRELIDHVEKNRVVVLPITYRDVQFKMEFPDLRFCRRGPYTILTDADYESAQALIQKLDKLDGDVRADFTPLLRPVRGRQDIQIVYVLEKKRFLASRHNHACDPADDIAGLYIPEKERLIIYDQTGGQGKTRLPELSIIETAAVSTNAVYRPNMQVFIDETNQTLRHEGAHHLFFKYGVHSDFRAENPWLIEGLACYFESETPGDPVFTYVNALKAGRDYGYSVSLEKLVNYRSSDGMMDVHPEGRVDMSYAESWALVRMLMQPNLRAGFFQYIRLVRNPDNLSLLADRPRLEILAEQLELTVPVLKDLWMQYQADVIDKH
jgi:hypothetical protein